MLAPESNRKDLTVKIGISLNQLEHH